jgi:hypothetical protein
MTVENVPLSVAERFTFCQSPCPSRSAEVVDVLQKVIVNNHYLVVRSLFILSSSHRVIQKERVAILETT